MGVAQNAIATQVSTPAYLLWNVPATWSLAEAATVPVAYATAYYALLIRGRLRANFSVLIHSGSGAVGLAAIQICLSRGCEVLPNPLKYIRNFHSLKPFSQPHIVQKR
jgi:fatty acid synthase